MELSVNQSVLLEFAPVLPFDDIRWLELHGGYRTRFDPRALLRQLESAHEKESVWHELWGELHHQGDVGEASFAAVPHIVRIYKRTKTIEWNTYAIVAIIELARNVGQNPDLPAWLRTDYFDALRSLAETGAREILHSGDIDTNRAILSILALSRGLRVVARFLITCTEGELSELESRL
jgi:hypothetical protein